MDAPETRYTTSSGDISIAYQVVGEGPPDVVVVPGFVSHADLQWEMGPYKNALERIASFSRMAVFDKRGIGLSERTLGVGTVEDRMDDIRAVMDAAGMERAHVVGVSEGGPLTIVFAATYPERVESLTIWASWARVRWAPDYPQGIPDPLPDRFIDLVAERWGSGHGIDFMVKNIDESTRELVARMERAAATPTGVRKILSSNVEIDVRDVLPTLSVPTLVINRTDDPLVPIEIGRHIADGIPGARFLELPGDWHVNANSAEEVDCYDAIVEFVTGDRPVHVEEIDRVLATVLFTDICDSTARAAELGDAAWRDLLEKHDRITAEQVERHRGELVKTTGDGALATFDGPARAVRCAQAVSQRVGPLGIDIRAGLHTGEIERRPDDIAGIAVHIGARIGAAGGPGEILVSQTVRDLVVGSELEFEPRGAHDLKGLPGEWQLYAVAS